MLGTEEGAPGLGPRSAGKGPERALFTSTMTRGVYCHPLQVGAQSIDFNQHVNNVQFVQWLQDVAMAHSAACGWPLERYQRSGTTWVVRSHFVEYLRPARLGDDLLLATWIAGFAGDSSPRRTLVWRPHDRKLLARAETVWVFIDAAGGRSQAVPSDFVAAFDTQQDEKSALQALRGWVSAVCGGSGAVPAPKGD